jgi:short-chain Z-isoprenyl diphosphate synthase
VAVRDLLYAAYERRVAKSLRHEAVPRHVGVMLDGNRRWARANGFEVRDGHQAGADKIKDLLHWCEDAGVEVVTLWLLSTDNLSRSPKEIVPLLQIIETAVADLAAEHRWRLHPIGALDLLPAETARSLKDSAEQTRDVTGLHVNVAVGYGGRREIADAVRAMLLEQSALGIPVDTIAENVSVEEIDAHLYTKGQPDPDLVIRTSGEQRLGGFLLWQSAKSEFYFCEAYWPDFRHVDFLRALRSYAERERRFGR